MSRIPFAAEFLSQALQIPGTYNFRDIGGYETVDGGQTVARQLFRSDSLHNLEEASHQSLAQLGIRTVVDLRGDQERSAHPDTLGANGPTVIECPILSGEVGVRPLTTLPEMYNEMIDVSGAALTRAVKALATPGALPAVVHCAAGKDRTGLVIALVLTAIGVPTEIVVRDFAATEMFLTTEFLAVIGSHTPGGIATDSPLLRAEADDMRRLLHRIDEEYGGTVAYLKRHGLTEMELQQLREQLTAPVAA